MCIFVLSTFIKLSSINVSFLKHTDLSDTERYYALKVIDFHRIKILTKKVGYGKDMHVVVINNLDLIKFTV